MRADYRDQPFKADFDWPEQVQREPEPSFLDAWGDVLAAGGGFAIGCLIVGIWLR